MLKIARAAILFVLLSACSTAPGEIFNQFDLHKNKYGGGKSITTGARQRVILNHDPNLMTRPGLVTPSRIVCTEPSPDVAAAVANSFGAAISVLGKGSGSISGETIEGIAQLAERTASIQLLRERMFRACEAYSNGAITGTSYTLLMNGIGRELVTTNLGENAAGRFGRSLAALGSKASSSAEASLTGFASAIEDIGEASSKLAEAEAKVFEAKAKLAEENAKPDDQRDAEKVTVLQGEVTKAEAEHRTMRELLKGEIKTATEAEGEFTTVTAAGSITSSVSADVAIEIRKMQSAFLDRDPLDAVIDACAVEMANVNLSSALDERFHEAVVNNYVKRQDFADPDDARGLAISTQLTRVSGLADYCRKNLTHVLALAQEKALSLKGYQLEVDRADVIARKAAASVEVFKQYNALIDKCQKFDSATEKNEKKTCLAAAEALRTGDPSTVAGNFAQFRAQQPPSPQSQPLPTIVYDSAALERTAFDTAKQKLTSGAFTVDPAPATGEKPKQREYRVAGEALKKEYDALIAEGAKIKTDTDPAFAAAERPKLEVIENTHVRLMTKLTNATGGTLEHRKAQAEIQANALDAEIAEKKYKENESRFTVFVPKAENLLTRIKAWKDDKPAP